MCILRLYAKQILLCPESGIFMPSDLNDPVISCACKLEKFLCALVRELLCLESGNIELRYSNMHESRRELLCLTKTIALQQGSGSISQLHITLIITCILLLLRHRSFGMLVDLIFDLCLLLNRQHPPSGRISGVSSPAAKTPERSVPKS